MRPKAKTVSCMEKKSGDNISNSTPKDNNLRTSFESKLRSWDASGDGVVDADDLLATFDIDGDGTFDKAEIAQIAKQLNEQTVLNNGLLQQLSDLEVNDYSLISFFDII